MWRKNARCIPFPIKKSHNGTKISLSEGEKYPLTVGNNGEYPLDVNSIIKKSIEESSSMYVYDNQKYEKALKDQIEKLEKKVETLEKENNELRENAKKRYVALHEKYNSSLSIQSIEAISYVLDNETNEKVVSVKTGNEELDKYLVESISVILNNNP